MKTLEQHNKEALEAMVKNKDKRKNGIACPKCGEELLDSDNNIFCSIPPQRNINCKSCGYTGLRYC